MKDLFEAIGNLLVEFTWKRFFGFLLLAIVLFALLIGYERYTNTMYLGRIEKSTSILKTLKEIDQISLGKDKELLQSYNYLKSQLYVATNQNNKDLIPKNWYSRILVPEAKWKFLTGGMIWWLFSGIALIDVYRKKNSGSAITLFVPLALISAVIGALLPNFDDLMVNYLLYPLINMLGLIAFILVALWIDDINKRVKALPTSTSDSAVTTSEAEKTEG